MAFVVLEDLYGVMEVVVFPNVYERCVNAIAEDRVVAVRGTLNFKEDEAPKILADEILDLEEAVNQGFSERNGRRGKESSPAMEKREQNLGEKAEGLVKVKVPADVDQKITLEQLRSVMERHRGNFQVLIYLPDGRTFRTERNLWVEPTENLKNQLIAISGYGNVKIQG